MAEKRIEAIIVNGPVLRDVDRGWSKREQPFVSLQEYLDTHYPALSTYQVAKISRYIDSHFIPKKKSTGEKRNKRHSAA